MEIKNLKRPGCRPCSASQSVRTGPYPTGRDLTECQKFPGCHGPTPGVSNCRNGFFWSRVTPPVELIVMVQNVTAARLQILISNMRDLREAVRAKRQHFRLSSNPQCRAQGNRIKNPRSPLPAIAARFVHSEVVAHPLGLSSNVQFRRVACCAIRNPTGPARVAPKKIPCESTIDYWLESTSQL
jgi:hypothetical protein